LVKNGLKKSTLVEKVKEWSEKVLTSWNFVINT
jgi:hypothetical protein